MSDVTKRLEEQATLLFNNVSGWQTNALKRIGRRIKNIKSLSYADLQALNNATIAKQDIDAVLKELSELTNQSIPEVRRIYSEMIEQQHEENRPLYDYRNKPFVPFADNKPLQAIVRAYARTTADTMIKLSMTKAKQLGFADRNGNFVPIEKNFIQVLDKAVMSVATGTGDFGSEMRDVLKELGGSGLRIDYGGGVTRRLDTMVRQNLLWGAKQAQNSYSALIGEELNCNGIEIDFHFHPRPSHEFFQGKQYSTIGKKVINGVTYPDAEQEGVYKALNDYGCLHFSTPILLGISEPRYSPEELERLNEQNKRKFNVNGKELSGYECRQGMRRIETEIRKTKDQMEILKASGDNTGAEQLRQRLKVFNEKYKMIAETTGIKPQQSRMAVIKTKIIDNSIKTDIIEQDIYIAKSLGAAAFRDTIMLPNGKNGKIQEGSTITKVVTFAGKGTNKELRVAKHLAKQYNIPESEWKHSRGDGYVVCDDGVVRHAELHWFESDSTGRIKMKVKRYFNDES